VLPRPTHVRRILLLLPLALQIGCNRSGNAPPQPPPPVVTVATPLQKQVIDWNEFTGYLQSPEAVDVRARVGGQITEVDFEEGSLVHKGDVLVRIDPRPYKATLDAKVADVAQVKAQVALAKVTLDRYASVVGTQAVSKTDYDTAQAHYNETVAQQQAAEAAVDAAKLDVEFCTAVAPITGRISYKYVTAGNLIAGGSDTGTLLTTINSVDPIYCYVNVDERSVLNYRRLLAEREKAAGRPIATTRPMIECYMGLLGEEGAPHKGTVDFANNRLDVATGTLLIRAVFPNTDAFLTPGLFARLRVPASDPYNAVLIPEAAIGTQQSVRFVYVLQGDNTVKLTPVELGTLFGQLRAIKSGVGPSDKVVINGLVSIRDGVKVTPQQGQVPPGDFRITGGDTPAMRSPATAPATMPANEGAGR